MPLPVILGTSSKFRHAVFRDNFDMPFTHMKPSINERAVTAGYTDRSAADPSALTLAVAHAKADALLPITPPSLLITSDQVVSHAGLIREKPADAHVCREYLRSYSREPLKTVTAVVVTHTGTGARVDGVDVATQRFTAIPDPVIDQLIAKGDVLHCAGGIAVEDALLAPYLSARDGDLTSIMGLPVELLRALLARLA